MISHHISHSHHFLPFTDIFATSYMQFSHSNSKCERTLQDAQYVQPIADSLGMGLPLIKVSNKYYDIADLIFLSLCLYVCTSLFLSPSLNLNLSHSDLISIWCHTSLLRYSTHYLCSWPIPSQPCSELCLIDTWRWEKDTLVFFWLLYFIVLSHPALPYWRLDIISEILTSV